MRGDFEVDGFNHRGRGRLHGQALLNDSLEYNHIGFNRGINHKSLSTQMKSIRQSRDLRQL